MTTHSHLPRDFQLDGVNLPSWLYTGLQGFKTPDEAIQVYEALEFEILTMEAQIKQHDRTPQECRHRSSDWRMRCSNQIVTKNQQKGLIEVWLRKKESSALPFNRRILEMQQKLEEAEDRIHQLSEQLAAISSLFQQTKQDPTLQKVLEKAAESGFSINPTHEIEGIQRRENCHTTRMLQSQIDTLKKEVKALKILKGQLHSLPAQFQAMSNRLDGVKDQIATNYRSLDSKINLCIRILWSVLTKNEDKESILSRLSWVKDAIKKNPNWGK